MYQKIEVAVLAGVLDHGLIDHLAEVVCGQHAERPAHHPRHLRIHRHPRHGGTHCGVRHILRGLGAPIGLQNAGQDPVEALTVDRDDLVSKNAAAFVCPHFQHVGIVEIVAQ